LYLPIIIIALHVHACLMRRRGVMTDVRIMRVDWKIWKFTAQLNNSALCIALVKFYTTGVDSAVYVCRWTLELRRKY